jgi:C4-dicarboxylate-specific signal transduction histidine kinase
MAEVKYGLEQNRTYNHVIIENAYDGPGILPEIQPQIFEQFLTTKR